MISKRRLAKIVNFAVVYVIGPFGLAQRVGIPRGEAKKVIENYYKTYAGVRTYMEEMPEKVRADGGVVRSIFGRLRRVPDINHKNGNLRARARGSDQHADAGDLRRISSSWQCCGWTIASQRAARCANDSQVHDELVFEIPKQELAKSSEIIKEAMEGAATLDVPLVVEIGAE
jgi:DNA polymerase-1